MLKVPPGAPNCNDLFPANEFGANPSILPFPTEASQAYPFSVQLLLPGVPTSNRKVSVDIGGGPCEKTLIEANKKKVVSTNNFEDQFFRSLIKIFIKYLIND